MTTDRRSSSEPIESANARGSFTSGDNLSDLRQEVYREMHGFYGGQNGNPKFDVVGTSSDAQCYWDWAQTNFDVVDADKNGFLNRKEIEKAYHNSNIPKEQHYGLNGLRTFYEEIQSASNDEWFFENDGITRLDLSEYKSAQLQQYWIAERARRSEADE